MNIKLNNITNRLKEMNLNNRRLAEMIDVKYTTINEYLNGTRELKNMNTGLYLTTVNKLFTPFEQMVLSEINTTPKSLKNKSDAELYYDKLYQSLNMHDVRVYLSGEPASDDDGIIRQLPPHVNINIFSPMKISFKIFNDDLYKELNKNSGQKNKLETVTKYLK